MENKLTENQIQLSNERIYNISPVKVKYMLLGFYSQYMNIKQFGFVKLLGFSEGESIVTNFLTAVLDSEALAQEALLELRAKDITKILEITKRLNDLQDEPEVKNEQPQME